jgi:hypothetical protein
MSRDVSIECVGKCRRVDFSFDSFDLEVILGLYVADGNEPGLEPVSRLTEHIKLNKSKKKGVKGIAFYGGTLETYLACHPRQSLTKKDRRTLKRFTHAQSYDAIHYNGVKFTTKAACAKLTTDNSGTIVAM